jgi:hypothetical protein
MKTGSLLILAARPPRLVRLSLSSGEAEVLVPDCGGTPDGVSVDVRRGLIYWTNMGADWAQNDGFIERVGVDGRDRTMVVPKGATFTPKQLFLDEAAGLLYWADREGMRVLCARVDGSDLTVLVQTGEGEADRQDERRHCVGIAIDRQRGLLYWTQKGPPNGGAGRILRADLELPAGDDPAARSDVEIVFDALPEPIDLEWDEADQVLYWTDRGDAPKGNTLNRARLTDTGFTESEIILSGLEEGIGLALDLAGRCAYVSDLGGAIRRVMLDRPDAGEVVFSGQGPLTGIAFLPSS